MNKNYLFKVQSIKDHIDNEIYKVLKIQHFPGVNVTKFFIYKGNSYDWFCCNDFKPFEEDIKIMNRKELFEEKTCKTCNNMDTFSDAFLDYDLWEGIEND